MPMVFSAVLGDQLDHSTQGSSDIQRLINDLARLLLRKRRSDHIKIADLLDKAGLESLNRLVVKSSGLLAWKMTQPEHPLHHVYISSVLTSTTRSSSLGKVKVSSTDTSRNLAIINAQRTWNVCGPLREAKTIIEAKSVLQKTSASVLSDGSNLY